MKQTKFLQIQKRLRRYHLKRYSANSHLRAQNDGPKKVISEAMGLYNKRLVEPAWITRMFPSGPIQTSAEKRACQEKIDGLLEDAGKTLTMVTMSWTSDRHHGTTDAHCICLFPGRLRKLYLFFTGEQYLFILYDFIAKQRKISHVYRGRDVAYRAYERDKITFSGIVFLDTEPFAGEVR